MRRTAEFRIACVKKAKEKARRSFIGKDLDDKGIGKLANCHCRPCSCYMCGNPRKYYGVVTRQEKIAALSEIDE